VTVQGDSWNASAQTVQQESELPSLSVAIERPGEPVWAEAFGTADRNGSVRAEPDTLYRVASITKLFTATAIMLLVERGHDLDRPVAEILPDLPSGRVTTRHLLCHGSGLQRETPGDPGWDTGTFYLRDDFRRTIAEAWFPFAPMERWKYSNLGFSLLGEVVETLSETPYTKFVTEEVIAPLGLNSTTFEPQGELADRRARGYVRIPDTDWMEIDEFGWNEYPYAAAALYSTPTDLCRFGAFLIGAVDGPLKQPTLELMRRPTLIAWPEWEQAHGLGPMIVRHEERTLIGHSGGLFGFSGWLLGDPESKVVACALTNVGDGVPLQPLVKSLVASASIAAASGDEPVPPPEQVAPLLGRYAGDATVLYLAWRKGTLVAESEPLGGRRPAHEIRRTAGGSLVFAEGPYAGEPMEVFRDESGRVTGFEVCTYRFKKV
jgi:CubicO group peptidase (beta-lactamase class C family)